MGALAAAVKAATLQPNVTARASAHTSLKDFVSSASVYSLAATIDSGNTLAVLPMLPLSWTPVATPAPHGPTSRKARFAAHVLAQGHYWSDLLPTLGFSALVVQDHVISAAMTSEV
jgi:hypothetical protein